ncbi:MAG: hypothetical protein ACI9QD_000094 [Thermoproteota archaeon]|jgi:hypothetical protein
MFSKQAKKLVATNLSLSLILIFLSLNIYATELTPKSRVSSSLSNNEKMISTSIIEEFKKRGSLEDDYFESETIQKIVETKRIIQLKKKSRGQNVIEKQKAKVRARLAEKRGDQPKRLSGKEKIKQMLEKNKRRLKEKRERQSTSSDIADMDIYQLAKQNEQELIKMRNKVDDTLKTWVNEYDKNLKKWAAAREIYLKNVDKIKKTSLEKVDEVHYKPKEVMTKEIVEKKISNEKVITEVPKGMFLIDGAFQVAIQDQGFRPTCSTFSGIRAVEIMMQQHNAYQNLSEQYFYWASKPKCRTRKCNTNGSWVGRGFDYSIQRSYMDIPTETSCAYSKNSKTNNDTQIPLRSSCTSRGVVKVIDYKYLRDIDSVAKALINNRPVIASITLSENFYKNKGLVLQSEVPSTFGSKDSHAGGHSVLFVGMMKMPKALRATEGNVCFLTANSWGIGWGRGGHACLSERWVQKHRRTNPFVVLNKIKI